MRLNFVSVALFVKEVRLNGARTRLGMLSYVPPVAHLLMLPFLLVFTGVVQWVFVSDKASAPGNIGEIYGKFGQYTLAYFPWDRAHSIAWLVIGVVLVAMSTLRIAISSVWSDSEEKAVDDSGWADGLIVVSLLLVAIFYVPAIQIARPGWPGVLCAVLAACTLLCAMGAALVAIWLYDPWGRKSIATLLFGEITWGVYAGWLVYTSVMAVSTTLERLRYAPDPHWLYRVISAPSNEERAKMYTASIAKWVGVNPRGYDPNEIYTKGPVLHDPPNVLPSEYDCSSNSAAGAKRPEANASMLVPASVLLGVGAPNATKSAAQQQMERSASRKRLANQQRRSRSAFEHQRYQNATNRMELDMQGNLDGDDLANHEARATTQWFRYQGTFVRESYQVRRRTQSGSDADDSDSDPDLVEEKVYVRTPIRSGAGELAWGVLFQAVLVGGAAVALRSPTMPILPLIAFNNLVLLSADAGPRLMVSLISVVAMLGSMALGVWRWTEA